MPKLRQRKKQRKDEEDKVILELNKSDLVKFTDTLLYLRDFYLSTAENNKSAEVYELVKKFRKAVSEGFSVEGDGIGFFPDEEHSPAAKKLLFAIKIVRAVLEQAIEATVEGDKTVFSKDEMFAITNFYEDFRKLEVAYENLSNINAFGGFM